MAFSISKTFDHGTANPIVARLWLQVGDIIQSCNIRKDVEDGILALSVNSLVPGLLGCWEIRDRFELEFQRQIESYNSQTPNAQMIQLPRITTLDQDSQNFLYSAKNFLRDLMKLFNFLYGTNFEDASDYLPPKGKRPRSSVLSFAEQTFGSTDRRTVFLKKFAPNVERIITYRNAVEHPNGYSGPLEIRNFQLENGKLIEPCWRLSKDINAKPASIRSDLTTIIETLLTLAESVFVSWADHNLKMPDFNQIEFIPREQRDPNKAVKYRVGATHQLLQRITEYQKQNPA
jgi:hypothetical protein